MIRLEDGDLAEISADGIKTSRFDGRAIDSEVTSLDGNGVAELGDYPHFMLKVQSNEAFVSNDWTFGSQEWQRSFRGLGLTAKHYRKSHVRLLGCGTACMLLRWVASHRTIGPCTHTGSR